jgi:hypothetical protein
VLSQTVMVPEAVVSAVISLDVFWGDPFAAPNPDCAFDLRGCLGDPILPFFQGDLMRGGADVLDFGEGVLASLFSSADSFDFGGTFPHIELNVTDLVRDGGNFQLRFGANSAAGVAALDHVSFNVTALVPEPTSFALLVLGALLIERTRGGPRS